MSSSTRKKTIFNRFGTRSVAYETLLWMFLWGLYGLWAGFSPAYPESKHSEPLFPLVIFAFMAACFFLFGDREELVFLGREIAEQRNYSEEVAEEIDSEVRRIIDEAYGRARDILVTYRRKLDAIAQRLIEIETIDREEFELLVAST